MKYTILLTEKPEGGLQVSIPVLQHLSIEADTRDHAIDLACKAISEIASRSEIVQVEVPNQIETSSRRDDVPWPWLGFAKDGPTWELLFDEIERHRDLSREVT